jgi:hypothetical protein
MVQTFGDGMFAPSNQSEFGDFMKGLPKRHSSEHKALLKGVLAFGLAYSGSLTRQLFLEILQS